MTKRKKSYRMFMLDEWLLSVTERYRSGHNGPDSKSGIRQRIEGSNPSLSARRKKYEPLWFVFLSFYVCQGIRTGWQAARNDCLNFSKKRADQTTDGTVVCNPGVIASVRKRKWAKIKTAFIRFYHLKQAVRLIRNNLL